MFLRCGVWGHQGPGSYSRGIAWEIIFKFIFPFSITLTLFVGTVLQIRFSGMLRQNLVLTSID